MSLRGGVARARPGGGASKPRPLPPSASPADGDGGQQQHEEASQQPATPAPRAAPHGRRPPARPGPVQPRPAAPAAPAPTHGRPVNGRRRLPLEEGGPGAATRLAEGGGRRELRHARPHPVPRAHWTARPSLFCPAPAGSPVAGGALSLHGQEPSCPLLTVSRGSVWLRIRNNRFPS